MLRAVKLFLVSTLSTVAALAVLEGALRLVGAGAGYWDRTMLPTVIRDPDLWIRLRPNVTYESKESGTITTSSHGTRGGDFAMPKPPGRYRIIAVGDSVTFGWGVSHEEAFAAVLQDQLRARCDVDVINAGQPSFSSHQGLIYLERDLLGYAPDLVLFCFGHNDRFQAPRSDLEEKELDRSLTRRLQRTLRRSRIYTVLTMLLKEGKRGQGPGQFREGFSPASRHVPRVNLEEFARNLERVAEACSEKGVRLVLVTQPSRLPKPSPYNQVMRDVAAELDLVVVDMEAAFQAAGLEGMFVDNVHPSPRGHRLFAAEIERLLAEEGVCAGS